MKDEKEIDLNLEIASDTASQCSDVSFDSKKDKKYLECIGCGQQGRWRKCTKNSVCDECKKLPTYRLMARTNVLKQYPNRAYDLAGSDALFEFNPDEFVRVPIASIGLTRKDLIEAYMEKKIEMFTMPAPSKFGRTKNPMRLYFQYQVEHILKNKIIRFKKMQTRLLNTKLLQNPDEKTITLSL